MRDTFSAPPTPGQSVLAPPRIPPTGVNPTHTYTSPWFAYTQGTRHTLAGHGDRVIGTFGRQGMNMDAIGLVLIPAQPTAANDAPAHSGN